jgi:hypothetical protein
LLDVGGIPRWLVLIALVGGAGAAFTGVAGFLHVSVPGALFNRFAFLVTLWLLVDSSRFTASGYAFHRSVNGIRR